MNKSLVFLFTFVLAPSLSSAVSKLTMGDYLKKLEKSDPEFFSIFEDKKKIQNWTDKNLPSPRWNVTVEAEYGQPESNQHESVNEVTTTLEKSIIETGTTLQMSHTKNEKSDRNEDLTKVTLEQSVFRNFLGRDNRLKKELLQQEENKISDSIKENYEDYLYKNLTLYLQFKKSYWDLFLAKTYYKEALILKDSIEKRKKLDVASSTDWDQVQLLVLQKQENVINKEHEFQDKKQELGKKMGVGLDFDFIPDLETNYISKLQSLAMPMESIKMQNLRPVQMALRTKNIYSGEVLLKKRENQADVNLVLGYSNEKSVRFSTVTDRKDLVLGFNLEWAVGDSQKKAEVELAQVDYVKSDWELKVVERDLNKRFKILDKRKRELNQLLTISEQKIRLSARILKKSEQRYQIGKITLEQWIDFKNNQAEFQLLLRSQQLELTTVLLEWLSLSDRLLEAPRVL